MSRAAPATPDRAKRPYRPEIDGLRAVAVVLVLLFHLDVSLVQGGYVGVDVFFVISGYLITRNIIADGDAFSLTRFYLARLRRLYPALLATIIGTTLVGAVVLDPASAEKAARAAAAAALSVSNVLFWIESGYWDADAITKPLLHTWSLGVEEQFYLVWPALLLLTAKLGSAGRAIALGAVAAGGFIACELVLRSYPSAAFYLSPLRAWQFAIGALIAVGDPVIGRLRPRWAAGPLIVAGLATILWAGRYYGPQTAFPGVSALLPTFGAAAIIVAGGGGRAARLLDNPPAVFIGRISYSLYLVHWPAIVLYLAARPGHINRAETVLLLGLSVALGYALHRLVETPFRRAGEGPLPVNQRFLAALGASTAAAVALAGGALLHARSATSSDYVVMTIEEAKADRLLHKWPACGQTCLEPKPDVLNILVLGDSHALDAWNMAHAARPDANILFGGRASCAVFVGARAHLEERARAGRDGPRGAELAACAEHVERVFGETDMLREVDIVLINALVRPAQLPLLAETVAHLKSVGVPQVVVFGNAVMTREILSKIAHDAELRPGDPIPEETIADNIWRIEGRLRATTEKAGGVFISKRERFCDGRSCSPFVDGHLMSYDKHHLSRPAAEWFGREALAPKLDELGL
ncbi:MAG: acyltransferase family protein [Pseudomonadota bacterium]